MGVWSRPLKSPSVHLAALAAVGVLAYAYGTPSPAPVSPDGPGHPAGCHVCSTIPAGAPARLEAYLAENGYVDAPGRGN